MLNIRTLLATAIVIGAAGAAIYSLKDLQRKRAIENICAQLLNDRKEIDPNLSLKERCIQAIARQGYFRLLSAEGTIPFPEGLVHWAIERGEIDIVENLIRESVSISTCVEGISPFYRACEVGELEIAKLLLKNGANPVEDSRTYRNRSERRESYRPPLASFEDVPVRPREWTMGRSPVFIAIQLYDEGFALELIERGVDLERDYGEYPSLMGSAVLWGESKVVQKLLQKKLPISQEKYEIYVNLASCRGMALELLEVLWEYGDREVIRDLVNKKRCDKKVFLDFLWRMSKYLAVSDTVRS